jgi:hypothetical protein
LHVGSYSCVNNPVFSKSSKNRKCKKFLFLFCAICWRIFLTAIKKDKENHLHQSINQLERSTSHKEGSSDVGRLFEQKKSGWLPRLYISPPWKKTLDAPASNLFAGVFFFLILKERKHYYKLVNCCLFFNKILSLADWSTIFFLVNLRAFGRFLSGWWYGQSGQPPWFFLFKNQSNLGRPLLVS